LAALAVLVGLTLLARALWPSSAPAPVCPNGEVQLDDAGVLRCGKGAPLPVGQAMTLGRRSDLNRATAADLALVPGVGPALAKALVSAREARGGFTDWGQVDAVEGVGPVRLEALRGAFEIRSSDGGTW